jgi:hypothetical protein
LVFQCRLSKKLFRFFEPFRQRLASKLAKTGNMIYCKTRCSEKNVKQVLKKAEFDAYFESIEKAAKY